MQLPLPQVENERWREVPGWPSYEVSDRGRIRRLLRRVDVQTDGGAHERELSPRVISVRSVRGRLQAQLRAPDGRWRSVGVAALVLAAFVGPRPRGLVAAQARADEAPVDGVRWVERGRGRMPARRSPSTAP